MSCIGQSYIHSIASTALFYKAGEEWDRTLYDVLGTH